MRVWKSEQTTSGLVTRQLHWLECLSDHGKKVQSIGAAVIAVFSWGSMGVVHRSPPPAGP